MQAISAVEQRRADTPNAVVDFTHTHGITGSADIGKTALVRGDVLAFDALRQKSRQALRLIHIGQQHSRRRTDQQRLGQPFLVAATQRLRAVDQFDANRLAIAGHH
ncbi:hypothetical protein D3C81_2009840 [compost metagenome]